MNGASWAVLAILLALIVLAARAAGRRKGCCGGQGCRCCEKGEKTCKNPPKTGRPQKRR